MIQVETNRKSTDNDSITTTKSLVKPLSFRSSRITLEPEIVDTVTRMTPENPNRIDPTEIAAERAVRRSWSEAGSLI